RGEIGKVAALLLPGPAQIDRHGADRGVRTDHVRERGRRPSELLEREAVAEVTRSRATVLLRKRQPEEAEGRHLTKHVIGDAVRVFHLLLEGHETRLDELTHRARAQLKHPGDVAVQPRPAGSNDTTTPRQRGSPRPRTSVARTD